MRAEGPRPDPVAGEPGLAGRRRSGSSAPQADGWTWLSWIPRAFGDLIGRAVLREQHAAHRHPKREAHPRRRDARRSARPGRPSISSAAPRASPCPPSTRNLPAQITPRDRPTLCCLDRYAPDGAMIGKHVFSDTAEVRQGGMGGDTGDALPRKRQSRKIL